MRSPVSGWPLTKNGATRQLRACAMPQDRGRRIFRFDAALADIGGAVEAYGQDPRLTAARAGIVHAKALWERAEAIKLALKESQQRLTAKHPEQAVEGLEGVLGLYPGDEQLTAGLQLARQALEAKQREDAISEVSRVAGLQLANRDYRLALTSVEEGLAAFGPEDRLTALRAEILKASAAWDRSEAIRAALEQSSQSLKEGEPETAVAVLEAALRCYPDENRLSGALSLGREAVAARRREAAIDELYGQAEIRLRNREFDEAMQIVENGVGTLGEHVRLTALKDRILAAKADWARTESCRTAIENARQHLASDDPESAVQLLEAVLRQYPEEEQLTGAVASARLALEAKRKEEAIQAALRVAGTHLEQQRFDRALTVIDEVVQVRGEDARLMDLRDRVANAKADWVRSEQIGIAIRDSEEQIANGDPERAVAVLDAALAHYPDEEQLLIAAAGARQALDALRRETAIEILCRDIAAQLDRLEFDEALQGVELGLQNFGKEERLAALKAAIVARRIEWHRAETVRTALEQSRQCLAKDDPESAIQALDAARLRYPDEAALEEAIVGARQAVESKRRDLAIEDSCREARLRLERHEFDSAIAEIDRALEEHGADARLTSLRDRICSAEAAWKCEEAIARAIAEANRCLSENDPEGAVQVLEPAIARYADDERLSSAAVSARQAVESKRRDAEVDAICRSAAVKAEGSQFDAALDEIAGAIQNYGADQRLVALQQKIEIAKARYQRREAIRSVLEACEQHLSKGAADQALRLCEQALERYPGDRQLLDAAAGARQAIDVERRAAVEKLTREIRQYLKKHQFERAASAVSLALRRYPGEPALTQLEVKVAEAAQSWEREQSVRRALSQAAELQGRNHFSDALQVLKKALDDNPGEPRLATAYQEIEADYRRQQDEEALGAALEQANLLMDTDPEEVVRLLEAASKNHPTDQRVIAALAAARECREVRRRERSIEAVCRETQVYLYSREFAPALDTI